MKKQPNILFIYSDQHRWSALNCYGNKDVISPNFDKMAAEGVRFTHAISSCPVCAPVRSTIQTGLHAHQHNVRANQTPWIGQHFKCCADYFNDADYETCFIGKAHWGKYMFYDMKWKGGYVPPERRMRWKHWYSTWGHDQYGSVIYDDQSNVVRDSAGKHQAAFQTDLAMEFIDENKTKPWIVQLNWGMPHTISTGPTVQYTPEYYVKALELNKELRFNLPEELFAPEHNRKIKLLMPQHILFDIIPEEYLDLYELKKLTVDPNVPEKYRKIAQYHYLEYYAMISMLDDEMGRIFDFLDKTGQADNTLVVYSSDHGDRIAAHCTLDKFRTKSSPHQNSYRVPMIIKGPGVGKGLVNKTPFNSVDILPTLLDCAGIKLDAHLPGKSLKECFTGTELKRDVLLSLDPWRAIYDGRYLYAISGDEDSWAAIHLIDTDNDPYDLHDLKDNPEYANFRDVLHEKLVKKLIETSDHEYVLRTGLKQRELK